MTKEKVFISEADQYLFAQGTHYDIYKKLGAHLSVEDGVQGVYFGVWAPNAAQVNVIGTFNEWNEESHPMQKLGEGGIWGLFIPGVEEGTMYKFLIYARVKWFPKWLTESRFGGCFGGAFQPSFPSFFWLWQFGIV